MKTAYFDAFSGISGDKIIGALINAGLDFHLLSKELEKIPFEGYSLSCSPAAKNGIAGSLFSVTITISDINLHRTITDINQLIDLSGLSPEIKGQSKKIFASLAEAEARAHGTDVEDVHFHEVGAIDSIIDIIGSVIALQLMGIERVLCSPIPLGNGFVECAHGTIPVPAPATVDLLKGIPVYSGGVDAEMTTPTGAAFIAALAHSFGPFPDMEIDSIGYGAGTRDFPFPNLLRVYIGKPNPSSSFMGAPVEKILQIETNIDDMSPEWYEYTLERLFEAGARDVFMTPIIMKKSRPGNILTVLSDPEHEKKLAQIIFSETTTSGLRISTHDRIVLDRESYNVDTIYGSLPIKIMRSQSGDVLTAAPEYEECKKIALKTGVPLKRLYTAAQAAAEKLFHDGAQ